MPDERPLIDKVPEQWQCPAVLFAREGRRGEE